MTASGAFGRECGLGAAWTVQPIGSEVLIVAIARDAPEAWMSDD